MYPPSPNAWPFSLGGLSRSTSRYELRRSEENDNLKAKIVDLAQERRRFAYRRITGLLRHEVIGGNHRRIYCL